MDFGVEIGDRSAQEVAIDVGHKALAEFGRQEGELLFVKRAPLKRQEIWKTWGNPRGIDREVVELMHRTHMGVDQDYKSLLTSAARTALADGWGGSMISSELQDILFGNPVPVYGQINLGVLKKDEVNVVVHGHEPLLPRSWSVWFMTQRFRRRPRQLEQKELISGMCCSANEILMRHGIPVAETFAAGVGHCYRCCGCDGG